MEQEKVPMSDKIISLSDSDAEPALSTGPDRAQRNGVTGLHFERGTHENVLAEMLGKVLAYNISQIIRVRKKLSEPEDMQRGRLNKDQLLQDAIVKESRTIPAQPNKKCGTEPNPSSTP
jgi:hypothetical protein